jgi:hypothetical protein
MKQITSIKFLSFLAFISVSNLYAQDKKVWVSGAARGVHFDDSYKNNTEPDTVTAAGLQSGHTMVDLGLNVMPNDNLHVIGMLRVRNDFGGFWGSGTTFDVRQLTVSGVLADVIKYQLGDIDYRLSRYTFNNNTALINRNMGVISSVPLQQTRYDLFYGDEHTWRQQGASLDFGIEADKYVKEIDLNGFISRTRISDFSMRDDRLFGGGSMCLQTFRGLKLGAEYVNLFDYAGTSNNTIFLRNPVYTGMAEYGREGKRYNYRLAMESGRSSLRWEGDQNAPEIEDFFYDIQFLMELKKLGADFRVAYRDVGHQFRSAGAQTMQINFDNVVQAYSLIGNGDQVRRGLSMMDLYRDASLYRTQIREGLMVFDPRYDNATPYGRATPNRKGLDYTFNYLDKNERFRLTLSQELLQEVVGQGTEELRRFNTIHLSANVRVDKFMKIKNHLIEVGVAYMNQQTQRTSDFDFENVLLNTNFVNINLRVNLFGNLDFLSEVRSWKSFGNESIAIRDTYSRVINFSEYNIDYYELMNGFGLQYCFSENQRLSFMWSNFSWTDDLNISDNYRINTFNVFFTMDF